MKNIYITALAFSISIYAFSQNKDDSSEKQLENVSKQKPKMIIIPSDNLMSDYDYIVNPFKPSTESYYGQSNFIPDYSSAIENNPNFNYIIHDIVKYFSECKWYFSSLEMLMAGIEEDVKWDKNMHPILASTMDIYVSEQMMIADQIYTSINLMDGLITFDFNTTNNEFGKATDISITAIDNFNKRIISTISSVNHEGKDLLKNIKPTPPAEIIQIIEDDIESEIDVKLSSLFYDALMNSNMCNEIAEYYLNLHFVEIDLQLNLESEILRFDDLFSSDSLNIKEKKLSTIVEAWLIENSIDSTYTISNILPKQMNIEAVKVPYNLRSRPNRKVIYPPRARDFLKKLRQFLAIYVSDQDGKYLKESCRLHITEINEMRPERWKSKLSIEDAY